MVSIMQKQDKGKIAWSLLLCVGLLLIYALTFQKNDVRGPLSGFSGEQPDSRVVAIKRALRG